jgi:hypothetical protein
MAITATAAESLAQFKTIIEGNQNDGPSLDKPHGNELLIDLIDYLIVQSVAADDLADIDAHFDAVKALLTAEDAAKVTAHNRHRPYGTYS